MTDDHFDLVASARQEMIAEGVKPDLPAGSGVGGTENIDAARFKSAFARLTIEMLATLSEALNTLHSHKDDLRQMGVRHAAVFGSVARGDARDASDLDVLIELDPQCPMGLFEYARVKLYIGELIAGADVVNRKTLKPLLKDSILRDAVNAF